MKYFTINELTSSTTAVARGIRNTPSLLEIRCLTALVDNVLDPARSELGRPITVTSGFRCKALNKIVGGTSNSQHVKGQAVDITCYDNKRLFDIIRRQGSFDQLIWEKGTGKAPAWVHVSYNMNNVRQRGQVLMTRDGKGYHTI